MRLIVLLLLLSTANAAVATTCVLDRDDLLQRPGPSSGPTEVRLQVYINDIVSINDAQQSFTGDVFMRVGWHDPRLAHAGDAPCAADFRAIWWPELQVMNRRSLERIREQRPLVMPDGGVSMPLRGFGEFGYRADLSDFPFDSQHLELDILSAYDDKAIQFVYEPGDIALAPQLSVANFTVALAGIERRADYITSTGREHARLLVQLEATRLTGFYTWQQLVPLFLVVLMAWIVFWIPREHVPSRIGLAATSMLTLIAYRFAMSSVLPPIAYLTRLDLFMIGASVVVFSALALAVAVTYVMDFNEARSERIHVAARYGIPLLLAAITWLSFFG